MWVSSPLVSTRYLVSVPQARALRVAWLDQLEWEVVPDTSLQIPAVRYGHPPDPKRCSRVAVNG